MPEPQFMGSAEHWGRVADLFGQMQEATDPLAAAAKETDPQVAADALKLWGNRERAGFEDFLAKPVELIAAPPLGKEQFCAGQILGERFRIERFLGAGGMGEVYLAYDNRLSELVAIKTIRRELAADEAVRRRFLAEVQNARRVTHPNVCRINDLFDEGGLPFLSMELLEGEVLSAWLEQAGRKRAIRRAIALQLAEALAAAHRVGILHCDFKPANIIVTGPPEMPRAFVTDFGLARALRTAEGSSEPAGHSLRAGTLEYMAPELLAGGAPTLRTDIFAYGRVLEQLLPKQRIAARCCAARAEGRPASLGVVIRSLRGDLPRRVALGAGIAAAAAAATLKLAPRPGLILGRRTRIAINGFRAGEPAQGGVFRELLITALRQSTLLTVVADDHMRSLLKSHHFPVTLPANRSALAEIAASEAALAIEGLLTAAEHGLKAALDIFMPAAQAPSLSFTEQVGDRNRLVQLADQTALRLRRELGESAAALRPGAGYTPLEQVTSASPEAVQCYFDGLREYAAARTEPAIAWFDQAVRIDPQFALAHLSRAVALIAHFQYEDSLESYQRAFELRSRVSERERLWIESQYFNAIRNYDAGFQSTLRLVTLYPEEARFQRQLGFLLARLGRPNDALPHNQRAVELDSIEVANKSEWIGNLTDAGRCDEALELYARFRREGETNTLLNWGAGLAYMGKDDFDKAYTTFLEMGSQRERDRWARILQCGPLMLGGKFAQAASTLASDLAWDIANREQFHLYNRRVWLGTLEWMIGAPGRARDQVRELAKLPPSPATFQSLREGGLLAVLLGEPELAAPILEGLRTIERRWPSSMTAGARSSLEAAAMGPTDESAAGKLFNEARGLSPDPLTLYHLGQWQFETGRYEEAIETLSAIETLRGQIHRLYFPPLATLARIQQARCLSKMSRFAESLRLYEWVTNHWKAAGSSGIAGQVRMELQQLQSQTQRGEKR